MILYFSVENFKSIFEKQEIKMTVSKTTEHSNILLENQSVLPSIAIYGANSSGKTNLISAIGFLPFLLNWSTYVTPGKKIPVVPFKLTETSLNSPSSFEIIFIEEDIKYYYFISLNEEKIIKEYLYYYPKGRQSLIFEREFDEKSNKYNYDFGTSFKASLNDLIDKVINNRLFLNAAANWFNDDTIKNIYLYLTKKIIVNLGDDFSNTDWNTFTIKQISDTKLNYKERVLNMLKEISNDKICDINSEISTKKLSELDLPPEIPPELKNLLITQDSFLATKVDFVYSYQNKQNTLSLEEESKGIKKLFSLSGPLFDILDNGKILIFDELETSIHPKILQHIVEKFHNPNFNKKNAQLIFTTHNTEILNLDLFRRDQIYFAEKNDNGSSEYYSLLEIKNIKKDDNIRRNYLSGKYGAIPFLSSNLIYGE